MPVEDQPPREIWHHNDRLKEWFDAVTQRREDRAKGLEPVESDDNDQTQNEVAEEIMRRAGLR